MRKIQYIVVGMVFLFSSCSNEFLDLYPQTSLNESNFYQSEEEFVLLVNGSYVPMRNMGKTVYWDISEVKSDNMTMQSRNTNIEHGHADNFLYSSANIVPESFWDNTYSGIYNANRAITAIEGIDRVWSKAGLRERSLGEAYFLRAFYYFDLVRQFGGIPIVTEEVSGEEAVGIKRSSVEEVYQLIVTDLETAIAHLENMGDTEEKGRASLGAAEALLGKVYLTRKDYAAAETYLARVIESARYGLLADYADVFDSSSKDYYETIFSIQYAESAANLSNQFIFYNAPNTSEGEITGRPNVALQVSRSLRPTPELIDAFEEGDKRFPVSIGFWTGPDATGEVREFAYCNKYKGPQTATLGWSGDNFPLLRYSDVLLMYAEVLNELGRTAEAIPYVQQVRNRAGLTRDLTGTGKAELTTLLENERQVEFCFENQRWYDLVRTERAIDVMRAQGKNIQPHHLLTPIPGTQIFINQLQQNPGY